VVSETNGEGDTTSSANIVGASATVTIEDTPEPEPGNLRFVATDIDVQEDAGEVTLTVERRAGSDGPVSVGIQLNEGSARTPQDFGAPSTTSLSWADGEGGMKSFTVPIVLDSNAETDETFTARLIAATPSSVLSGVGSSARVTIIDVFNSSPGRLQWTAASQTVNEDDGTVTLSVERVNGTDSAVRVTYRTVDGTAIAGSDYNATSGILGWEDGEGGSKSVSIPIRRDAVNPEATEVFEVILESAEPFGDQIQLGSPARARVSIENVAPPVIPDTPAGRLAFNPASYQVNESDGTVTLQVERTETTQGAVSVQYQAVGCKNHQHRYSGGFGA